MVIPRVLEPASVGIRFADCFFSDPVQLPRFSFPLRTAGIYVIMAPDPTWGPWHLQPLFFGEFEGQRTAYVSPAQQSCCLRIAGGKTLYVATYTVPPQQAWQLPQVKQLLIERYSPIANLAGNAPDTDIAHKLASLEKKILEHETLLKITLAAIGQTIQAPPEPRKRVVGFRPDPAGSRRKV